MLREQSVVIIQKNSLFGDIFDRAVASLPAAMCAPSIEKWSQEAFSRAQPQVSVIRPNLNWLPS